MNFKGIKIFVAGAYISMLDYLALQLLYLDLAVRWPKLMKKWSKVDALMHRHYPYPKNLDRRLRIVMGVVILHATGNICRSSKFNSSTKSVLLFSALRTFPYAISAEVQ